MSLPSTRLGITGGIGSGKSTVAQLLHQKGCGLIDADQTSRGLTSQGGKALSLIQQHFGSDYLDAAGVLNRQKMRELVFTNPRAKHELEAILHPLIAQACEEQATQLIDQGCKVIVYDIPLLVESTRWRPRLDEVWVIDCLESTQIDRVMTRSQLTGTAVKQIIDSQAPRNLRRSAADLVIFNEQLTIFELTALLTHALKRFGL